MDEVKEDLDALFAFVHEGATKPEIGATDLMTRVCELLSSDPDALGLTSGRFIAFRGDPGELNDKDLLAAIKPHVEPETYKEFEEASKEGILQDEYCDLFRDDSDDGYFEILEPVARAKGALEDMESASSFAFIEYTGSGKKKVVLAADYTWYSGDLKDAEVYKSIKEFEAAHAEKYELDGPHALW